jgi:hypothetical protein
LGVNVGEVQGEEVQWYKEGEVDVGDESDDDEVQ